MNFNYLGGQEQFQLNAMQQNATFPYQSAGQHSQLINCNPGQNTSNSPWQSQVTAGGTSWKQYGYPLGVQTYSNGLMISPEQGQSVHLMGLIPQQASQSLYGIPVSSTGGSDLFFQRNMDQLGDFHFPGPSSSFSGNPYAPHASVSEGKTSLGHASSEDVENATQLGSFNQVQQTEVSMSDGGGQGFIGDSDVSLEKSSQATVGLDPTEEKILFGNDDNIWEAFGGLSVTENDGADLLNGFPSMQSGTWSALMQSAVGETSSSDFGKQEEWNGLESQNSRSHSGNQAFSISQDNKNSPHSDGGSANNATLNTNYSPNSRLQQAYSNQRSSPTEIQGLQEGRSWLNNNSQIPDSGDQHCVPGPPEISSGRRVPVDCKFQYLPMGEVDVGESSAKHVSHTLLSPAGSSSSDMEKGQLSGVHPSYLPSSSEPFARSGEIFSPSHVSPSENMLEPIHKVDQSEDQNDVSYSGSTNYNRTSVIPAGGSFGHGQSQSSTSQGFNLQLVPPSQEIALSNLNDPTQCLPSLHRSPQFDSGNDKSGGLDDSSSNMKESRSVSLASSSTYLQNPFQNQYTTTSGGQMMGDPQSSIVDGHAYCDQQSTNVTGNISSRAHYTGISPQMAPSSFGHYGAFRNGQLLTVHNLPRFPMVKNMEQQFVKPHSNMVVQNSLQVENAVTDTCQIANCQITNAYSASGHDSSLHALVPYSSSRTTMSTRPKKRKTATSDLIPWNKEIGHGFKRIQNISSAEVDWAQSSNRLVERGGDKTDSHEDMSLTVRPRRRLILTTKLMQQVFYPPSASLLSLDGRSNYDAFVYSIARITLGDACNLVCDMETDSSPGNGNSLSRKTKSSERIRDQYFSKVMEDFMNRAMELENDLLRLDKCASILEVRLDCQNLERFSVINRFAKFHGRSKVEKAETSSTSNANAISLKCPQKYVTAYPMPRAVPERVPCLTIN